MNRYPISYIQYGNVLIRDSPTHPCPLLPRPGMGWAGVNPLVYFSTGQRP